MTQVRLANGNTYTYSYEHILDELELLDLLISLQVVKYKGACGESSPLDQFKGLVISDEEIMDMLNGDSTDDSEDDEVKAIACQIPRMEIQIRSRIKASEELGMFLPLLNIKRSFKLSDFDMKCLIICLAPEIHSKYEKLYAFLQDDVTRKRPTIDLILRLLCENPYERMNTLKDFNCRKPLLKYIIQFSDSTNEAQLSLVSKPVKLDERILSFILGDPEIDTRLYKVAKLKTTEERRYKTFLDSEGETLIDKYTGLLSLRHTGKPLVFYFYGAKGVGRKSCVESVCARLDKNVIYVDVEEFCHIYSNKTNVLKNLEREALLSNAFFCLYNFDVLETEPLKTGLEIKHILDSILSLQQAVFIIGSAPWKWGNGEDYLIIEKEFVMISEKSRQLLWEDVAGEYVVELGIDFSAISGKFRLTPGSIRKTMDTAKILSVLRNEKDSAICEEDIYNAGRQNSNRNLHANSKRVKSRHSWDDIILPQDKLRQLKEICTNMAYRATVYDIWGFERKSSRGTGLNVLFSGPSGTGKTLCAEIISNELGLELYKVDLSQVVSKYIGETEKNLSSIFGDARTSNAVLFFDEADALFGKRSEVKDSHDRYANMEVAYLLSQMEDYDGMTILATNLRSNMDDAFTRRMHFIVEYPLPDEELRIKIWKLMFPKEAPVGEDVDLAFLARKFQIAGGNIRNIVISAAFMAAEESSKIAMKHLVNAAKREFLKMGRVYSKDDFGKYSILFEN